MEKTVNELHDKIKERPELIVPFISELMNCPLFCNRLVEFLHADTDEAEFDAARNLKRRLADHYHRNIRDYAGALTYRP